MDFNKFLGKLDESKDKSFIRVSGRQLREAAGESVDDLKGSSQWYYVPQKEYSGSRHIVVENGPNDWAVYYLTRVGAGGAATPDSEADWGEFGLQQKEEKDLTRLRSYLLKEGAGEDNGIDLSGFIVGRKVSGDFATVLKECVEIVKKG